MAFGDIKGRARVNRRMPAGFAECDYCGLLYNLVDLKWQFEWYGTNLTNTGYKACYICLSKPQDQLRPIILPPDPIPLEQPRPAYYTAQIGLQGFSQYTIPPSFDPEETKTQVLATVASYSGIPTPSPLTDRSSTLTASFVAQQIIAANAARSWLLIYSPSTAQIGVDEGTASFANLGTPDINIQPGQPTTIMMGPGAALFWATAQNAGTVYQGAMTGISSLSQTPIWIWEA